MNKNKTEELLMENLCIGHKCGIKSSNDTHAPSIWEIANDLNHLIKQGLLVEVPITCTLNEVLNAEKFLDKVNPPYSRLLESDYGGKIEKIQFKTVPGNTVYQLTFSKSDRTNISGHFKKL